MAESNNMTSIGKGDDYTGENIPEHARIIFIIVGSIYTVCGVVGNIVIIVTIVINKNMRNPHFYFIINLAVSDLMITGYVLPNLVVSLIIGYYPVLDFNHCIFNGFVIVCGYVSSLLSLMVISVNRYLSVCHSQLFSRLFSNKVLSSAVGCLIIWLLSILSSLPCLLGWGRFTYDTKTHYCGYDRTYNFGYTLFLMLLSIGVPVAVVFACNFAMWRFVRQASHRIYAMTQRPKQTENQKHFIKVDENTNTASNTTTSISKNTSHIFIVGSSSNSSSGTNVDNKKPPPLQIKDEKYYSDEESSAGNHVTRTTITIKTSSKIFDIKSTDSIQRIDSEVKTQSKDKAGSETKNSSFENSKKYENDDIKYLRPWDGTTSNLIGLEIEEMRKEINSHKQQLNDNNGERRSKSGLTADNNRKNKENVLGAGLTLRKSPPRSKSDLKKLVDKDTSSGVLVTPDELALIKTIFIIFISFAVLMTPYMMSTLLDTTDQWSSVAHLSCSFTSFTNSCLNCVLYGIMTPAFKKAYRKLFTQCCVPRSSSRGGNSTVQTNVT